MCLCVCGCVCVFVCVCVCVCVCGWLCGYVGYNYTYSRTSPKDQPGIMDSDLLWNKWPSPAGVGYRQVICLFLSLSLSLSCVCVCVCERERERENRTVALVLHVVFYMRIPSDIKIKFKKNRINTIIHYLYMLWSIKRTTVNAHDITHVNLHKKGFCVCVCVCVCFIIHAYMVYWHRVKHIQMNFV